MSKITLNNVTTFTNDGTAVAAVNNNSNTIQTAFDNTLSRDGTSPNQMAAYLDMNSNPIINLPAPSSLSEPLRLQDAQTLNGSGTITVGAVPNGGTTGQVLTKNSNVSQDTGWNTPHYFPAGGGAGQYLTKNSGSDYDTTWTTLPTSGVPSTVLILTALTSLSSTTVGGSITDILCLGYSAAGDCNAFQMKRQASRPYFGGVQSLDGAWWLYVIPAGGIDPRAFGVKADWNGVDGTATDDTGALQQCIYFAAYYYGSGADTGGGSGCKILLPRGTMKISSTLYVLDGCTMIGHSVWGSVLKMATSFAGSSHFIRLGTPGDPAAVAASQTRGSAGNLVITGGSRYQSAFSACIFWAPVRVSIYSTGNDTGITFTVHGKDRYGAVQISTISGSNATFATTNEYYSIVDSVSCSGAIAGNVTVGYETYAAFGCLLQDLQLFSSNSNAAAGMAMVYTNNSQHEAGCRSVKIFAGNRAGTWFETGIGGASYFVFDGVETFNTGDAVGNVSNNPQMYFNYAGLVSGIRNVICGGPQIVGNHGIGIQVDGGFVHIQDCHCEGMETGILDNIRNINSGVLTIQNYVAGQAPWMVNSIKMDAASTPTAHLYVSGIYPNGSTNTINDARTATLTTGNIIDWTKK